jgi:large subunit ribosomal protein L10
MKVVKNWGVGTGDDNFYKLSSLSSICLWQITFILNCTFSIVRMAITKAKKEEILAELKAAFESAKGVAFFQNNGLSVEDFQALRNDLRSKGIKTKVAKKTLIKLAGKGSELDITEDILDGPIVCTFSMEDEIAAAQEMYQFGKKNEAVQLMGGVSEGKVVGKELIMKLAQLPSKLVGSLKAPISCFHAVTSGVLRGFVQVCKQLSEKEA